jgi:hypothetical protein
LFRKYQYDKSGKLIIFNKFNKILNIFLPLLDNYKKSYYSNNKFSKNNFGNYNNGYEYGNSNNFNNGFRPRNNNNYGGDEMRQSKYSNDRFSQNQSQNYDSFNKGTNYNSRFNDS